MKAMIRNGLAQNRKHMVQAGNRVPSIVVDHEIRKLEHLLTVQRKGDSSQRVGRASKGARGRRQR
jgi:hypothetical protein